MTHQTYLVRWTCVFMSVVVALWTPTAAAQSEAGAAPPGTLRSIKDAPPPPAGPATTPATGPSATPEASVPLKPEEVEQVVAGIALYPDSLLAQVLMASTYPLEVVQAERWAKANKSLKDKALADALNKQTWDASVKSLVNFPQVLTMMSEKLDWTMKLGDAFIADQKVVMDAVQRLRQKAQASGNLKTTEQQNVKVETVPAAAAGQPAQQVIVVESSNPSIIYVPTYNPTVVYGGWPYPSYPPYSYYPPGYVAGAAVLSFGVGVACGAAWGHAWGGCNWHGGDVDIDVDRNVNFNNNINREEARQNQNQRQNQRQGNQGDRQGERDTRQGDRATGRDTRQTNRQASGAGANARASGASSFQHDPSHRKGVSYRDSATNQKYRGSSNTQAAAARESYRGRSGSSASSGAGGADWRHRRHRRPQRLRRQR